MENQHRLIKGYRDLSPAEIALMNEIKEAEANLAALFVKVRMHLNQQEGDAAIGTTEERLRLVNAEPKRWASIAKTEFQNGFMALVRTVAQPATPWE